MNYVSVDNVSAGSTYALKFESSERSPSPTSARKMPPAAESISKIRMRATPKNVTLLDIYAPTGAAGEYAVYVHSKGAISAKDMDVSDSGHAPVRGEAG